MRVPVETANPIDRSVSVRVPNALVDTGALRTLISRALAEELQLEIFGRQLVRTPDGVHPVFHSFAKLTVQGRDTFNDIWVSDTLTGVLIGAVSLETLGFGVDPVHDCLIEVEPLLM